MLLQLKENSFRETSKESINIDGLTLYKGEIDDLGPDLFVDSERWDLVRGEPYGLNTCKIVYFEDKKKKAVKSKPEPKPVLVKPITVTGKPRNLVAPNEEIISGRLNVPQLPNLPGSEPEPEPGPEPGPEPTKKAKEESHNALRIIFKYIPNIYGGKGDRLTAAQGEIREQMKQLLVDDMTYLKEKIDSGITADELNRKFNTDEFTQDIKTFKGDNRDNFNYIIEGLPKSKYKENLMRIFNIQRGGRTRKNLTKFRRTRKQ